MCEDLVLAILRVEIQEMRAEMATKVDVARLETSIAELRSKVHSLRADLASGLLNVEKRLGDPH